MSGHDTRGIAAELLHREALALDERRWDDWLALFREDAVFWIPAWRDADTPTEDPEGEIALIYTASRDQLAERVARVRSGRSLASSPLPRTAHAVSNVMVTEESADALLVRSVIASHLFDTRRREQHVYFGRAEHQLQRNGDGWLIARKKVILLNDYLATAIDFYTV